LQKLELHVELCSRNYRIYPCHANVWFNRWIKKPTLAAVLDMVRCALFRRIYRSSSATG